MLRLFRSMLKKLLASVLVAVFLFAATAPSIAKAQTWYHQPFDEWAPKVFDQSNPSEIFGERYTYAQVEWIFYSVVAFLTSAGEQDIFGCLFENTGDVTACLQEIQDAAQRIEDATGSIEGSGNANFLAIISQQPISSITYFRDVAQRIHIIPEAKAQGFGFQAGTPILALWRLSRNVAYSLIVVVTIVIALMIMFRVKISPQTVISAQTALPKVVIAIVLITFSYAIAGFLIDLMYVVIGVIAGIFTGSGVVGGSYSNWGTMFGALTNNTTIWAILGKYLLTFMIGLIVALFSSGIVGVFVGVLAVLLFPLLMLILDVVLIFASFRILWLLIKTYVLVLLQIIIGPFAILLGVMGPGGFGPWIRNLISLLAVYPIVGFMFVISFIFLRGAYLGLEGSVGTPILDLLFPFGVQQSLGQSTWIPPLTVGTNQVGLLWLGASLGVILLIPNVANIISSLVSGKPFAYGSAIGQAFGPVVGPVSYVGGLARTAGQKYVSDRFIFGGRKSEVVQVPKPPGGMGGSATSP